MRELPHLVGVVSPAYAPYQTLPAGEWALQKGPVIKMGLVVPVVELLLKHQIPGLAEIVDMRLRLRGLLWRSHLRVRKCQRQPMGRHALYQ